MSMIRSATRPKMPEADTMQTPVCTTELSAVSLSYADFASRGVKVSCLEFPFSADGLAFLPPS